MATRAVLEVGIDPRGAVAGAQQISVALQQLRAQAKAAVAETSALSAANDNLGRATGRQAAALQALGHNYTRVTALATSLRAGIAGVVAALGIREVIRYADSWNLVEGRLRLVTSSTAELASVQERLFRIAQSTRQGFEATAEVYSRMARNAKDLGLSQQQLLDITQTINQAFIVSGTAAESARAALIQLGQGFASGVLRGEELNSVLEQAPRLAEAIAAGMGKTVGQLRALGAEGKLTAKAVADALLSQREAVEREFGKMPATVAQATTAVSNSMQKLVGSFDDATGFSEKLAKGILGIAGALDRLASGPTAEERLVQLKRQLEELDGVAQPLREASEPMTLQPPGQMFRGAGTDPRRLRIGESGRIAADRNMRDQLRRQIDALEEQQDFEVGAAPDLSRRPTPGAGTSSSKSEEVLRDLQREIDLLQQTSREREISNALKKAEIDLNTEMSPAQKAVADSIAATAGALHDQKGALESAAAATEIATAQAVDHEKALLAAKERSRELSQAQRDRFQDLKDEAALAQKEVDLIGLSSAEREVELRLRQEINRERREGLPLSQDEIELRRKEIEVIVASQETIKRSQQILEFSEDIADSLIDNFRRAKDEGESLMKRLADGVLATLEDLAFEMAKKALIVPISGGLVGALAGEGGAR